MNLVMRKRKRENFHNPSNADVFSQMSEKLPKMLKRSQILTNTGKNPLNTHRKKERGKTQFKNTIQYNIFIGYKM